jgi:hypothetical protein
MSAVQEADMPFTREYVTAMQGGVLLCLALEEAAPTITPSQAVEFAHRLNAAFQRAQDAHKVAGLRDEEREFAYNVGRTDERAALLAEVRGRVEGMKRVPGSEIPHWCDACRYDTAFCKCHEHNSIITSVLSALDAVARGE